MSGSRMFERASLLAAFDAIGAAARTNGARLEFAVYGGAALMLAGNFRFATEDVDIAELAEPWPIWLRATVSDIAARNGWAEDWLNDAVTFHLSPLADRAADHLEFGSFPRDGARGLTIVVPTAEYMLALKLKAMRITDPFKGPQEGADIRHLMRIVGVDGEGAMDVLRRYFPRSAEDGAKQRFLLKRLSRIAWARPRDPAFLPCEERQTFVGQPTNVCLASEEDGDAPRYGR